MKKIEIFDMNGPEEFAANPMLVFDALRLERSLQLFELDNVEVGLYSLSSNPKKYIENKIASDALENDLKAFPLTFVDGNLVCKSAYPSREELAAFTSYAVSDLPEDPSVSEVAAFMSMISGSCSGGDCASCSGSCASHHDSDEDLDSEFEF